jgi:hemoglobin
MNRYFPILAGSLVLIATACAPPVDVEAEKSVIRELDRAWEDATAADGAEGWVSFVTEDAVIYPPDDPTVTGKEAIGEYMQPLFPPDSLVRWLPDRIEVSSAGDMAYMFGTYEITVTAPGDEPLTSAGKYGNAWTKTPDGTWKVVASVWNADQRDAGDQKTLYQRVGGYDVVAAILDGTGPRVINDPELSKFFPEVDEEMGKRGRQLAVNLLCELTGGPCFYIGPDLKMIHTGLGITDEHWQSFLGYLAETMDELNMGDEEKTDVIAVFAGLKGDIVVQPEE